MIARFFAVLTACWLLYSWSSDVALAERRVALIMGNSTYQNVIRLPNPAKDAAAVADLFKRAGFDVVEIGLDLDNTAMRRKLREFASVALTADIAVVYYAGHGIELGGANYLIPVDAKLESDLDVDDETISLDRIIRMLEPVRRLRLVMLDACRENPFVRKMTRAIATRSVGRGLAQVEVTSSDTLIAFAAKAGMTAADGEGQHSPFTAALLDNLAIPGLDLRIAFGRVRDEVMSKTNNGQEPYVYGSIGGATVALVPKPVTPPPAAKPAISSDEANARTDYAFAAQIGTREAWDSFLAAHKSGFFANLARAARDKIVAAEQRLKLGAEAAKKAAEEKTKRDAAAKLSQAPIVVATAPVAAQASAIRHVTPAIDHGDLVRLLQFHLQRVGCDPGSVDGKWTERSMHALEEFNKRAHTTLDAQVASIAALDVVKQQKARVCPLVCGKGFKAEDDHCVEVACRRGFMRNKAGDCERATKSATHPAPREAPGSGSGQVYCTRSGCQPVPRGCRAINLGGSLGNSDQGQQRLSCN